MAAEFSNYYHSMDREYFQQGEVPALGISAPPMEDQLSSLKLRIRQGVTNVELGFMGVGKGSMQGKQTTPEMYGREEREAIRELAKINKVSLSTHSTPNVMGFAGLAEGGFSDEQQQHALFEVERAIDFAADTARGGPVVVHIGEWQRPLHSAGGDNKFLAYPKEEQKGQIFLARKDTGQLMAINKEIILSEPEVKEWYPLGEDGKRKPKDYKIDDNGNIIMKQMTFDQMVTEAKFRDPSLENKRDGKVIQDEEIFIRHFFDAQKMQADAESKRWTRQSQDLRNELVKLNKKEEQWKAMYNIVPESERWKVVESMKGEFRRLFQEDIPSNMSPWDVIDTQRKSIQHNIDWEEQAALGYAKQVGEIKNKIDNLRPIEEIGIKRSAEAIARAAMFAYDQEKEKNLEKPLFVAPEAFMPEHWGSHPKEMETLILASREALAHQLAVERGMDSEQAKKVASDHIKATFDVGHAYTWRKFFQPETPGETMEETDKRFNKWLLDNVKRLAEKKIIGHVHLSDNFGYYDEHLTPGMGKAPIKEFLSELKKAGVETTVIVEPAHQDIRALHGAMGNLGSSVYGVGKWADIEQSYFGRMQPPYFTTEAFMPVQREWQISYFGIPFE